jgi:hypothetical protein
MRIQFPSPDLCDTAPASGDKPIYSFASSEEFEAIHFANILKTRLDEFFRFFDAIARAMVWEVLNVVGAHAIL